ncbi:LysE family translocator [Alphaproteobacteria bacterium KMM 3653]|uniref:LysE family translocator n=1 Tax=Harenicola maris TaxID=2841044 RepID=A0AAP2CTG5_9RHOB|nr:LysE family translocator [Harenicola maris]
MIPEILPALLLFALVASITPGPNNLMLMASGANFGFARSLPHMFGIGLGFSLMVLLVGAGLMQIFDLIPHSDMALKLVSVLYMLWLAWKIANAAPPEDGQAKATPMTFLQAALFQWVNPKAWSMALSANILFAPGKDTAAILWVGAAFLLVSLASTTSWTVIGQQMRRLLTNPARLRAFNWLMAALLVASLYPVLHSH